MASLEAVGASPWDIGVSSWHPMDYQYCLGCPPVLYVGTRRVPMGVARYIGGTLGKEPFTAGVLLSCAMV